MFLQDYAKKSVQDTLAKELRGQESLFNLCNNHPRKPLLVKRVIAELTKTEKKREITREIIEQVAADFTRIFINAAKTHKEQQMLTDCQKDALNSKATKKREAEELWNEVVQDNSYVVNSRFLLNDFFVYVDIRDPILHFYKGLGVHLFGQLLNDIFLNPVAHYLVTLKSLSFS